MGMKTSNFIPTELKSIPFKIVENGLFKVFKNGRIFRLKGIKRGECPIHKSNGYLCVSGSVDGIQRQFYVHRLLALAFIKNPKDKPCVVFKDGDRSNVSLDNLAWATNKEVFRLMKNRGNYKLPNQNFPLCKNCKKVRTKAEDFLCSRCKDVQKRELALKELEYRRIKPFLELDLSLLTKRQKEIVEKRLEGKGYAEIAKEENVSRQAIESLLKNALNRHERIMQKNKLLEEKLNKEIKKIKNTKDENKHYIIKALMLKNNLNYKDMAELIDISDTGFRNKINKKTDFTLTEMKKISLLFDKTLDDLFAS